MLPIKVYGHKRSGNNLLLASLFLNWQRQCRDAGEVVENERGERKYQPYAKLFGGHAPAWEYPEVALRQGVYVVRDPRDCLDSLWAFLNPNVPRTEFITRERVGDWCYHVRSYKGWMPFVRFEPLVRQGLTAFPEIIKRLPEVARIKRVSSPVGWSPRGGDAIDRWRQWTEEEKDVLLPRFDYYDAVALYDPNKAHAESRTLLE